MKSSATFNDNSIGNHTMRSTLESHSPVSSYDSSPTKEFPPFLSNSLFFEGELQRGGELAALDNFHSCSSSYSSTSSSSSFYKNSSPSLPSQFDMGHINAKLLPGATGHGNAVKSLSNDLPTAIPDKDVSFAMQWDTEIAISSLPSSSFPAPESAPTTAPSSKLVDSLTPEEVVLKRCPRHISRTTLCSRSPPRKVLICVDIALKTHDADVKYIKEKHQFTGFVFIHHEPLFFSARLYAGGGEDDHITCLEFKRDSSDGCLAFSQFYGSVVQQLEPHLHHWCYGSTPQPTRTTTTPNASAAAAGITTTTTSTRILPHSYQPSYRNNNNNKIQQNNHEDDDDDEGEVSINDDILDVMFSMLASNNPREQKDAIQVLTTFTASKKQVKILWGYNERRHKTEGGDISPLVLRLKSLLSRADLDSPLLRSTAAILKHCAIPENMDCTTHDSCFGCQAIRGDLCEPLFALLDAPESLKMKDVQRQLACALANLTLRHAACIRKSKKKLAYIATLERICGESGRCNLTVEALKTALTRVE